MEKAVESNADFREELSIRGTIREKRLREQIAAYLLESRGVKTDANSIMIGEHTANAYLSWTDFKNDFSGIIVEDPGYVRAREAFQMQGFTLETSPVYETGADFSALHQMNERLIYVTPSHHSPYGVSMSIQERQALIHWAAKKTGIFLKMIMTVNSVTHSDPSLHWPLFIHKESFIWEFLKIFSPRHSPLLYGLAGAHFTALSASISSIRKHRFFAEPAHHGRVYERRRMDPSYQTNARCLQTQNATLGASVKHQFGHHVSVIGEQSGLYILVKVHENCSEESLIQRALEYGVKVYPTALYFVNNASDHPLIKLGFGHLGFDDITHGVQLLKQAWGRHDVVPFYDKKPLKRGFLFERYKHFIHLDITDKPFSAFLRAVQNEQNGLLSETQSHQ